MQRTTIIGIDGLGGAGKSTIAEKIQREVVGSVLLHIDDFIHPEHVRNAEGLEPWKAYYFEQWRYTYLIENILEPIRTGKPIERKIEFYLKSEDSYVEKWIHIPAGGLLIIEGVFLQRAELRDYFDTVIFVDMDKETRIQRVLERDSYIGNPSAILTKYNNRYFPAEEEYVREYDPANQADLVLNESADTKRFHDYLLTIAGIL
ncbi:uridine kinase [Sporosarcina sp. Te-1]|uniref:uridine kinase n=1 Tax=Sporosarcina sp. Te-1 TaxID=2818390 RepID=UPI001A9EEE42|nr:uridine kinase [Sporosarcina sp. Te-1]QTD42652.1 uridine kinase [Sporosarcina sp. Te-1]